MSLSNRVSLDTDVLFVRNMFVFSTNTNNVPVNTNTILAIGPNGQMVASNTLYNLSTYGVGYLPSTLSSLNGEIISIGNLVLAGGVIPAQLISVQTALQNSISSTQGSVDTLSSYILLDVIPSTVSTFDSQVSGLNSSFQGYVTSASVTPGQLASTYTAATDYTDQQISTLTTNTENQISTLSNYFDVSSATVSQFSTLEGEVVAQSNYFSTQLYLTNSNFNALSTTTRILNVNNSTLVGGLVDDVSTLTTLVVNTSTIATPFGTLGLLSTSAANNWPFFSNIKVSSIDVRATGTALAPAISFTSGSDNDTGFFHPADGVISITTNSGERFRFSGTQLIGCNSDIVLNGTGTGFQPNINLNTTNTGASPHIAWSNTSVYYRTYLAGPLASGFGSGNNQLTTYASLNVATSIHSTGNVAIRSVANGSNALYVNGSTFINGQLAVTANSTALDVTGSTIISGQLGVGAAGSAAAPALTFTSGGDTNTGIYHPSADTMIFAVNGQDKITMCNTITNICTAVNVLDRNGFGGQINLDAVKDPNINLISASNNYTNSLIFIQPSTQYSLVQSLFTGGTIPNRQLVFIADDLTSVGNNVALAIHSTGNVGIRDGGNGSNALYVYGSTFINGQLGIGPAGSATAPSIYFSEIANDTGFFKPGDGAIGITTNGVERFRFSTDKFIGCNSEVVLNGANQGQITFLPNAVNPEINLNTFSTGLSPNIGWSNTNVYYRTFLSRSIGGGFVANNQLQTYAYNPTPNPAIAIHSTGTVGIRGAADPTFALTVAGGIRQTIPYLWSYLNEDVPPEPFLTRLTYTIDEYDGPGSPMNLGIGTFTIPYTGAYIINFVARTDLTFGSGGVTVYLVSNEGVGDQIRRTVFTNINGTLSILYTKQLAQANYIFFNYFMSGAPRLKDVTLTIQYLG